MGDLNLDVSSQYFWETTYKDSPKNYITQCNGYRREVEHNKQSDYLRESDFQFPYFN